MSKFDLKQARPDQGVFVCKHVFQNERAIHFISREDDGDLVFSCGEEDHDGAEDWMFACIHHFNGYRGCNFEEIPPLSLNQVLVWDMQNNRWVTES